jgi:hypothetical protein
LHSVISPATGFTPEPPLWARQIVVVSVGRANADLAVLRGANVRHSRAPIGIAGRPGGARSRIGCRYRPVFWLTNAALRPACSRPVAMAELAGCVRAPTGHQARACGDPLLRRPRTAHQDPGHRIRPAPTRGRAQASLRPGRQVRSRTYHCYPWRGHRPSAGARQRPETQGADLEDEPEDHACHAQQPDRLAGQAEDEPDIKARISYLLAPWRWHTEAVAVQKLAAMAGRIAFSISRLLTFLA